LLPSGREYGNGTAIDGLVDFHTWGNDRWLVRQGQQRHLLQAAYTDSLVGRMLERLRATSLYDKALVVVTADHGVSFVAGALRRGPTRETIADIARVPLFVKFPGQTEGRVDARAARTIDIVPTIADVLGVELPWSVDGRSLRRNWKGPRSVAVSQRDGKVVEASTREVERRMRETLRGQSTFFGRGLDGLFEIGSRSELLGVPVTQLRTQSSTTTRAHFDGEELFERVRPSSSLVPARITGVLDGAEIADDVELAVAVNGRIAALTRRFRLDGKQRFSALVPETVFREGQNRVELFSIDGTKSEARLIRLGETSSAQQYELAADGTSIGLPDGRRAPVESGRIAGRVETWTLDSGTVRLRGWAADVRAVAVPDQILVFASGRLIYSGETNLLVELASFGGEVPVGWTFEVPARDIDSKHLRVFALRGSIASELPVPRGFPWA
jgi:hypothetical protein